MCNRMSCSSSLEKFANEIEFQNKGHTDKDWLRQVWEEGLPGCKGLPPAISSALGSLSQKLKQQGNCLTGTKI